MSGTSIAWDPQSWSGLSLTTENSLYVSDYGALQLWVNGGSSGGQQFTVEVNSGRELIAGSAVTELLGHSLRPDVWERIVLPIPLSTLHRSAADMRNVTLYADSPSNQPRVYVDDVQFISRTTVPTPPDPIPSFPAAVNNCLNRRIKVMPLGDSLTEYAQSYRGPLYRELQTSGFDVDFVGSVSIAPAGGGDPDNEGHGGYGIGPGTPGTPGNISDNVRGWLQSAKPDVILLDIGANDVGARRSLAIEAPEKLARLLQVITSELPSVRVLVGDVPPNGWMLDTFVEQQELNQMAAALGGLSSNDTVTHVPIWSRLRNGWNTAVDTYDNVHFTVSGGGRFAQAWLPEVRAVLNDLECSPGTVTPTTTAAVPPTVPATTSTTSPTTPSTTSPTPTTSPTATVPTSSGFSIGNQIFHDLNNNGWFDEGEPGLAGVTLRLLNNQVSTGRSVQTDGLGRYRFNGLSASTGYQVCVDPHLDFIGSNGSGLSSYVSGDPTGNDPNNYYDNDDNGRTLWDGTHCTGHIILSTALPTNDRVDIGLIRLVGGRPDPNPTINPVTTQPPVTQPPVTQPPVTQSPVTQPAGGYVVGNLVFEDRNNNGFRDPSEPGIPGIVLSLKNNLIPTGRTTVTGADGSYEFDGLSASTGYQVCVEASAGLVGSNGTGVVPPPPGDPSAADPNNIVDNDDNGRIQWDGGHCTNHVILGPSLPSNLRVDIGLIRP